MNGGEEEQLAVMGMVGHWVSAILQTAGMYGQSHMLESYSSFIFSLGTLIFMFAMLAAIATVAIHGNFGQLIYFLVGPGLFLFMLTVKVDVCSVRFQFGEATIEDSCSRLKVPLLAVAKDYYRNTAKVSWFYAEYDRLVSYLVEKTVSVITDTSNNQHLIKFARERLILKLARARVSNPDYQALLSLAMLGECATAFAAAMDIATIGQTDTQQSVIAAESGFDPMYNAKRLEKATNEYMMLREQPIFVDEPIQAFLNQSSFAPFIAAAGISPEEPLTCHQVWLTTIYGAYLGANTFFAASTDDQRIFPAMFPDSDTAQWDNEVVPDVQEKLYSGPFFDGSPVFIPGVPSSQEAKAAMILAGFYMRNALTYNTLGPITVRNRRSEAYNEPASRIDYSLVAKHETAANGLELMHFAAYVPYAQGILLYFLSVSFPFFAVFLLIPGRQGSFFLWMSIWAWAKSWDIGFAMVHVLRDVMWQVTPSFASENSLYGLTTLDFTNPATLLAMVFQNDPIENLNMYFFIVSMFTIGVPIISAQMFTGASKVFGAISKGYGNGLRPQAQLIDNKASGAQTGLLARHGSAAQLGSFGRQGTPMAPTTGGRGK